MATIIKRLSHERRVATAPRAAAYNLTDMADHAEGYLASVRHEAQKIVAQARQEAAAIRQQAEIDGRRAAEATIDQALNEKIAAQMVSLTPALEGVIQQIQDARQSWLRHWEASVVRLAQAMAGRLVRRELEAVPELSLQWTREALELTAGASAVTVRLHPTDVESLGEQTTQLIATFRPLATAQIIGDESITQGGCRIETELGSVDQQVETQLQRLAEEML